jgi:4-hydroxy-3-methylbut-2-enyl diphosphate reductase
VEVAERAGCRAQLIEDATDISPEALIGVKRVGLTAGASAPDALVRGVVAALDGLGGATVTERAVATESAHFKLPTEVRPKPEPTQAGDR